MAGAAVRKPRVPNDKLHRVTDSRLAEADRKVLHEVCRWSRLARYGGFKSEGGNLCVSSNAAFVQCANISETYSFIYVCDDYLHVGANQDVYNNHL